MNYLSSKNRPALLQRLQEETFDVLVIGGGATGAGICLDAASRGLKVALLEKQDFAAGTSSRSTKLIHGGLRYLKQLEIGLVRETGRERTIVHHLAPHLVVSEKMLLPLVEGGTYGKLATSMGLMLYDLLAGVDGSDRRIMLSKEETLKKEPLLRDDILKGGGFYAEYRTDDARLTVEVLKTSATYGALFANYAQVDDFMYDHGLVCGARCTDLLDGEGFEVKAKQIISAAGPWVDELREKNNSKQGKRLHLTKGVHIVLPHDKLPVEHSVYFDIPDGRMLFAIPRGEITYLGTTDTNYTGEKENPRTNLEDVQYLINGANSIFPNIDLKVEDVISSWAGLRPLIHEDGKSASELSRKDEIFISESRLISIAGGKLTGYRKMAERAVDVAAKYLKEKGVDNIKGSHTEKIVLAGGEFDGNSANVHSYLKEVEDKLASLKVKASTANYLVHNYGRQTDEILADFFEQENLNDLGIAKAELRFGLEKEMIQRAQDFFTRRTGRLYFDIDSIRSMADDLLDLMKEELNWDNERREEEKKDLEQAVEEASTFPPGNNEINPELAKIHA